MDPGSARPDDAASSEHDAGRAVLAATRDLLWIDSAHGAQAAATRLVEALGGVVVAADDADDAALPVDVSFGEGPPLVPSAAPTSVAHMLLSRHLPGFVRDAHRAVELAARTQRLAKDAEIDRLTGLANRRILGRALARLKSGDVVVMLDLDRFKALNDELGHAAGDQVLHAFGRTITSNVRARDLAGRYGGEEFLLFLSDAEDSSDAELFLERLRSSWEQARPHPVSFSAGLARVGADPKAAVPAADAAMYAAKHAGRDRWLWAEDTRSSTPPTAMAGPTATDVGFVAHSRLAVPGGGRDELIASFRDRLGRVDGWPGFRRLEVWADRADPTVFVMVSWWDTEETFRAYMGSKDHRDSHERIPAGELRPRPDRFSGYEVIAR